MEVKPPSTADPLTDPAMARDDSVKPIGDYVGWLEARSMLYQADHLCEHIAGECLQWRHAFAHSRPRDFINAGSVWFTSYPKSIITPEGTSVLEVLGSQDLLATFHEIGITAIHLGPMKRAGGISGRTYTPTTDGFFDRIELDVDPLFGTGEQYQRLTRVAREIGVNVIGDLVPAHSGKGADFRLAELAYKNYEGLYTMIRIPPRIGGCSHRSLRAPTV